MAKKQMVTAKGQGIPIVGRLTLAMRGVVEEWGGYLDGRGGTGSRILDEWCRC